MTEQIAVQDLSEEEQYDLFQKAMAENTEKYTRLKLCEELAELSELLLKQENKIPERQPDMDHIVDEIGDVILRLMCYVEKYGIEERVEQRTQSKMIKLLGYYQTGKYAGGV